MRVVVTGATGNVGIPLLRRLCADPAIADVVGVARRPPAEGTGPAGTESVEWVACELGAADAPERLRPALVGADVVVHLAWLLQPSHRPQVMYATNVDGTRQVIDAVVAAGVPGLVHASSVGAYSPGPKDRYVDESWPTEGIASSVYSRHKVAAERMLDRLEREQPSLRVVRMRKALILSGDAGSALARYFLGRLVPGALVQPRLLPLVPDLDRLRLQGVHSDDVAGAYQLAIAADLSGPINLAAEPVLDPASLAELLGARPVPLPAGLLRSAVDWSWRLHLQPTDPGWLDLALGVPLLDTARARSELGWTPAHDAGSALLEALGGIATGAGLPTAVLRPRSTPVRRLTDAARRIPAAARLVRRR
jgi:UDP-glucose 4-epimerase